MNELVTAIRNMVTIPNKIDQRMCSFLIEMAWYSIEGIVME